MGDPTNSGDARKMSRGSSAVAEQIEAAIRSRFAAVATQLGFGACSYWVGGPNEDPDCLCSWQRSSGGLRAAVERDRRGHVSTGNAKRLVKIVLLTGEELWLRDSVGDPGVTAGGVALPVFVEDRLVGALAALDRDAGQLPEEQRGPLRRLCEEVAEIVRPIADVPE